MPPLGLYIHIPFCTAKCPYCDFYSLPAAPALLDAYTARLESLLLLYAPARPLSTIYFGGGTPTLLGPDRLARLLEAVGKRFPIAPAPEITLEANPTSVNRSLFAALRAAGFNRLSMGLQSANPDELALLGRGHTPAEAARAVEAARSAGFDNISLDLMLGLPGGSEEALFRSIRFAADLSPAHISAYILKVEPNTPFASRQLVLPDGDSTADQYLFCVRELASRGYAQYEISNFARPGRESRHNLLYWHCEEYLGLGPSAHSFYQGRRFFWPRDLRAFLDGCEPVDDGPGGSVEEFAMLNLRLSSGLRRSHMRERFGAVGEAAFGEFRTRAAGCPQNLVSLSADSIAFTAEGFLVSNALLGRILG